MVDKIPMLLPLRDSDFIGLGKGLGVGSFKISLDDFAGKVEQGWCGNQDSCVLPPLPLPRWVTLRTAGILSEAQFP